jgi:hypothetical protein
VYVGHGATIVFVAGVHTGPALFVGLTLFSILGRRLFKSHGVARGGHVGAAHGGTIATVVVGHAGVGFGGRSVGLGSRAVGFGGGVATASRPQMTVACGLPIVCSLA